MLSEPYYVPTLFQYSMVKKKADMFLVITAEIDRHNVPLYPQAFHHLSSSWISPVHFSLQEIPPSLSLPKEEHRKKTRLHSISIGDAN